MDGIFYKSRNVIDKVKKKFISEKNIFNLFIEQNACVAQWQ